MLNNFLGRRPLTGLLLTGLLVIALGLSGGCVTEEVASNAEFVLGELAAASASAESIELEGKTLVYSANLSNLARKVRSVNLELDKKALVIDYLILQERIDCILDDIEGAAEDDQTIQCQGKVLVNTEGEHGLLGVPDILERINSRDGGPAKRDYLTSYLGTWDWIQRVNRVDNGLAQIGRSNAIPVFGALVKAIHRFPILYEGNELVPRRDVPKLLDQYLARDTDEARRTLVMEYLER